MGSVNSITNIASKPFAALANLKWVKNGCKKFASLDENTARKALAYTTIGSIALKDGIGCYMYVKQSLNNKEIPENRRGFVAALDLTNGGLNILAQGIMFFTLDQKKVRTAIFKKFYNKVFSEKSKKALVSFYKAKPEFAAIFKKEGITSDKAKKAFLREKVDKVEKGVFDIFAFVLNLGASVIVAKRIIVPFIATPLASYAKDKYIEKPKPGDKKDVKKPTSADEAKKAAEIVKTETAQDRTSAAQDAKQPEFKGNLLDLYKAKAQH